MIRIAIIALALSACVFDETPDYQTPAVGSIGAATVEECMSIRGRYEPCGWVYYFEAFDLELCIIWNDRALVLGEPPHLVEAARSLYGDCALSKDPRFAGTPVCKYTCPSMKGCNSRGGCFCLDERS